jgi:hypothetical protein
MQNKWIQRLTLGLAATALFVAAGGPTYAATKINGKNIKKKSVAGNKLRNNTLTGTQINESKLGTVPKAASADTAANAAGVSNGSISLGKLDSNLQKGSIAAYASIDGFGPASVQQPYSKNIISVTKSGTGRYCLNVDWAAAGRSPAQQATPVFASARSVGSFAAADVYNVACPNNGISVSLNNNANAAADGWVHVIVP